MPSQLHESHLLLFRNRPDLAVQLMRDLFDVRLPRFGEARIESADLTEVQPAEYRADLVVQLWRKKPVYGIVVEIQLSVDERKKFVWPVYVMNLRARLRCPAALLVMTADDAVARWAAQSIDMGGGNSFLPYVLGPSQVPEIANELVARANPELAVLSAMAHGRDAAVDRVVEIASVAERISRDLDADRAKLYLDLILSSLSAAAREALGPMNKFNYEYQSDFAKKYYGEGRLAGRAELVLHLLRARFGSLREETAARVKNSSVDELDAIGERLLGARTLDEAVG